MQFLPATAHRRMPWKNGGGETAEIAVSPEGAGLGEFAWRISMAQVGTDGPFSAFPGIDRSLSVLEGCGIALSLAGAPEIVLMTESLPFAFAGDAAATARLVAGAITDLNVMTRRGLWRHEVERLRFGDKRSLRCTADIIVFLSRSSNLGLVAGMQHVTLGIDDAALVEGAIDLNFEAEGEATLFVARLWRA